MQRDFTNPGYIFFVFFGVIIPDSDLPKCTKTRLKWHKIAHKTSKHRFRLGLRPRPPGWGAYLRRSPDPLLGWGIG